MISGPLRGVMVAIPLVLVARCMVGCGCGGGPTGDGVNQQAMNQLSDANDIAVKVKGDYSKLTPDQKQIFLKMANNSESQAKKLVDLMAHPPNAGVAAAHHMGG